MRRRHEPDMSCLALLLQFPIFFLFTSCIDLQLSNKDLNCRHGFQILSQRMFEIILGIAYDS